MKQILVTGGAGFIGSHLTESLLARGDRVRVVDNESTGQLDNLASVRDHERFEFVAGSVDDADLVAQLTADVDEVYHLAAAVGVQLIASAPMETIHTNIIPLQLLLRQLSERHQRGDHVKLFIASSSEVYGKNPKSTWTEEDDLVLGSTTCARWSYGASKAIDEFMALACHREYGLPVVIGRFFNVVGPRQTGAYGMVLPRFVEAAVAGTSPVVHDDGHQVRCFAHVSDVVQAVVTLMTTPEATGRVFNIGSDKPISILELAKLVIAAADPTLTIDFQSYAEAYDPDFEDVRRRVPDLSRLCETIDFQPQYDLPEIVDELVRQRQSG